MAASNISDPGLIRTVSGRITYAPDGLSTTVERPDRLSDNWPLRNTEQTQGTLDVPASPSPDAESDYSQDRQPRYSTATTVQNSRSSLEKEGQKAEQDDEYDQIMARNAAQSEGSTPFSEAHREDRQDTNADKDLEKQDSGGNEEGEDQKDPNLVDWDGPDDRTQCLFIHTVPCPILTALLQPRTLRTGSHGRSGYTPSLSVS